MKVTIEREENLISPADCYYTLKVDGVTKKNFNFNSLVEDTTANTHEKTALERAMKAAKTIEETGNTILVTTVYSNEVQPPTNMVELAEQTLK